jgi:hypothetical protein
MKQHKVKAKKAVEQLRKIKYLLQRGELSYTEAKAQAVLPLRHLNEGMKEISKQHGFRHREVTFARFR